METVLQKLNNYVLYMYMQGLKDFYSLVYAQGMRGLTKIHQKAQPLFQVLGVFLASCICIVKSRKKRGCFHKSTTKIGFGEVLI